jgi:hypothetical protein
MTVIVISEKVALPPPPPPDRAVSFTLRGAPGLIVTLKDRAFEEPGPTWIRT